MIKKMGSAFIFIFNIAAQDTYNVTDGPYKNNVVSLVIEFIPSDYAITGIKEIGDIIGKRIEGCSESELKEFVEKFETCKNPRTILPEKVTDTPICICRVKEKETPIYIDKNFLTKN
ncbi:MAG: hypothetical protein AB7R69_00690 [Candidatus Babeliales bacterium]